MVQRPTRSTVRTNRGPRIQTSVVFLLTCLLGVIPVALRADRPSAGWISGSTQILGEAIGVAGTPFALHYASDRVPGRRAAYELDVPLDPGAEHTAPNGVVQRFRIARAVRLRAGRSVASAFYIGAAPERDGALATAAHFARIGADEIMRLARLDLSRLARKTADAGAAGLLNRNLLFACYAGIARAIDDDRLYFVRSRAPTHGACAVFGEREALLWLLPALTAADPFMAREALMRAFEQYSHRPGERARYLDGGVLEPGFCLAASSERAAG